MITGDKAESHRCPECSYLLVQREDSRGFVKCPECGTRSSPSLIAAQRALKTRRTVVLGFACLVYLFANVVGVALAAVGVVHPPWGVLRFFSLAAPAGAVAIILSIQLTARGRAFHWLAVCAFLGLAVAAAIVTHWLKGQAAAAV